MRKMGGRPYGALNPIEPDPWKRGWHVSNGRVRCTCTPPPGQRALCADEPARIPAGALVFLTGEPGEVFRAACARAFLGEEPPT